MQMPGVSIRPVSQDDAGQIAAIYAPYVLHGTATFDIEAPKPEQWQDKIAHILARGWPFIVAADEAGSVIGYAYATQFRDKAAFAHSCENSIYLRGDATGQGIGRALLTALMNAAAASGFTQMIAVITSNEAPSLALHTKLGFRNVGLVEKVGYKFGQWLDTVYMQRALPDSDRATD
jgi:L-amino acid N-acyltransferase YncA